MSKFAIIPHGWFLHLGRTRLYRNAAKVTLMETVVPKMTENGIGIAIYSAPELEAQATADTVAAAMKSSVAVDPSLSDERGAPLPQALIAKLVAAMEPAIIVTHRGRLKMILRAVRSLQKSKKLAIVGRRPFFGNQALLVDPEKFTVDVISIR